MIELKGVTKIYKNGVIALNNVSLKIEKGEFVFVVGPSGAGKSTLIKMIMKEIDPSSGTISVSGKNLSTLKRKEIPFYRRGIGVVFQDFRLLQDKNVYDNVAFAMQIAGASPREIRREVPLVLGYTGLSSKAKSYPSQISGGEQQRTCIARAIVNKPRILIADEPTGNLDPTTSMEIMKILNEINLRGTTVIMATHAKEIVNSMKKRVIAFQQGAVRSDKVKGVYFDAL